MSEREREVVPVAVPQMNNGIPTLVLFAVPTADTPPGAQMTFDEARRVALGPPLVLTAGDFVPKAWTVNAAAAYVAGLDFASRENLADALRAVEDGGHIESLVTTVREAVDKMDHGGLTPIAVVFDTDDWDNGVFLSDASPKLFYAEGGEPVDMPDRSVLVGEQLTELYGRVPSEAGLGVDLRTGEVTYDDAMYCVYDELGLRR